MDDFAKSNDIQLDVEIDIIAEQNWNADWESSFDPVEVEQFCSIRAPFHAKKEGFEHEIIIMPKMSFGTGHHFSIKGNFSFIVLLNFIIIIFILL